MTLLARSSARRSGLAALAALPLALVLLAGCAPAAGQPEGAPSGGAPTMSAEDYQLAMDKCMTEEGSPPEKVGEGSVYLSTPESEAASATCTEKLGTPPGAEISPAERKEIDDARLRFFACLRDAGYDLEPPSGGAGQASSSGWMAGIPEDVLARCSEESGW